MFSRTECGLLISDHQPSCPRAWLQPPGQWLASSPVKSWSASSCSCEMGCSPPHCPGCQISVLLHGDQTEEDGGGGKTGRLFWDPVSKVVVFLWEAQHQASSHLEAYFCATAVSASGTPSPVGARAQSHAQTKASVPQLGLSFCDLASVQVSPVGLSRCVKGCPWVLRPLGLTGATSPSVASCNQNGCCWHGPSTNCCLGR